MTKVVGQKHVAVAGAVLCFAAVACGSSTAQALSATKSRLPAVAAARPVPANATAGESPGPTSQQASPRPTRTQVPARSTPSTTPHHTTSTTILGGGSPATWPAAKAVAPSLAGAYSPNLKTAFIALVKYSDWLGSHPNPRLVKNYVITTSSLYRSQVYLMQQMVKRAWRISPQPTQIDFLKIVVPPVTRTLPDGHKYQGGIIETVMNEMTYPYLNRSGKVVGHTAGGGPTAYAITLVQDSLHTQFYLDVWQQLTPTGGGLKWEQRVGTK
jgi:hypothetical protein